MITISKIIIISLFCCGLKKAMGEGMILNGPSNWLSNVIKNDELLKPIVGCVYCFASFWGTLVYWGLTLNVFMDNICPRTITEWIIVCVCCIFTNGLFYGIISKYENYIE